MKLHTIITEVKISSTWVSPDTIWIDPDTGRKIGIAFIYNIDNRLDTIKGGTHQELIERHADYYSKAYGFEPLPKFTDYEDINEFFDIFSTWIREIRQAIEKSALIGRIGKSQRPRLKGAPIVAFWNDIIPLITSRLPSCLNTLEQKGLIKGNIHISIPGLGIIRTGDDDTRAQQADQTRIDPKEKRRLELEKKKHQLFGIEKMRAMKELGYVPDEIPKSTYAKSMREKGHTIPGQKWWAPHSEEYNQILSLVCETKRRITVAIDLDGTLAQEMDNYNKNKIGDPVHNARAILAKTQALEVSIIINTCRSDTDLVREWLQHHDIPFNYINENPDQPKDTSDKIMADRYWDNKQPSWRGLQYAYEELTRYLKRA